MIEMEVVKNEAKFMTHVMKDEIFNLSVDEESRVWLF